MSCGRLLNFEKIECFLFILVDVLELAPTDYGSTLLFDHFSKLLGNIFIYFERTS